MEMRLSCCLLDDLKDEFKEMVVFISDSSKPLLTTFHVIWLESFTLQLLSFEASAVPYGTRVYSRHPVHYQDTRTSRIHVRTQD